MTPERYRLIRTIATGGMAHVYEGVAQGARGFERRVAIKRVLPELSRDASMGRMFLDEARIASHLHHGNIVQVLDYGVVDESEFIAMEFIDGVDAQRAVTLAARSARRMPASLALHVTAEIAHALDYAHRCRDADGQPLQIVHRDVSPHNILLSWDGDVKLSDFGIAKATHREERTETGVVKGKLAYMAPEQAAGGDVTSAADVYSLGATLYALLTGNPPGSDASGPAIDRADPSLSEEVVDLIEHCIAPRPVDRPATGAVAFRAGQLAARAMDRDARGALGEWLAPLRSSTGKVSALDDLMGLALVASGPAADDAKRRFTVSRAPSPAATERDDVSPAEDLRLRPSRVPTAAATPAGAARGAPSTRDTTGSLRLPTRWNAASLTVGAGLGLALVVAGALVMGARGDGAATGVAPGPLDVSGRADPSGSGAPPTAGSVVQPAPHAGFPTEPGPAGRSTSATPIEPPSDLSGAQVGAGPSRRGEPRRGDPRRAAPPAPSRPPVRHAPTAPASSPLAARPAQGAATGDAAPTAFVRVPRATGGQERVEVDGSARGFTPVVLRLPVGAHRLVIRDAASGRVLFTAPIELARTHTRVSPLVISRRVEHRRAGSSTP